MPTEGIVVNNIIQFMLPGPSSAYIDASQDQLVSFSRISVSMLKTLGTAFSASLLCLGFAATSAFATPTETSSKGFTGNADWYSDYYHLKKTASGALHDKTKFMAAHRTLPFGTKLLVINHRTGKECVVTVNDRGPFTPNRVLDLSYAAAKHLGITTGSKMLEYKIVAKDTKATEAADLLKPAKSVEVAAASKPAKVLEVVAASKTAKVADVTANASTPIWVKAADAAAKPVKSSDAVVVAKSSPAISPVATIAKSAPIPGSAPAVAETTVPSALTTNIVPKAALKKEVALDPSTVED